MLSVKESSAAKTEGCCSIQTLFNVSSSGDYAADVLEFTLTIKRRIQPYLLNVYIPSVSLVCIALLSLPLDERFTTAKVLMCLVPFALILSMVCLHAILR